MVPTASYLEKGIVALPDFAGVTLLVGQAGENICSRFICFWFRQRQKFSRRQVGRRMGSLQLCQQFLEVCSASADRPICSRSRKTRQERPQGRASCASGGDDRGSGTNRAAPLAARPGSQL